MIAMIKLGSIFATRSRRLFVDRKEAMAYQNQRMMERARFGMYVR